MRSRFCSSVSGIRNSFANGFPDHFRRYLCPALLGRRSAERQTAALKRDDGTYQVAANEVLDRGNFDVMNHRVAFAGVATGIGSKRGKRFRPFIGCSRNEVLYRKRFAASLVANYTQPPPATHYTENR